MRTAATPPLPHSAGSNTAGQLDPASAMWRLRQAHRRPAWIIVPALTGLYLLNAIAANVAPGLMAVAVIGPLNVGAVLVLLQGGATGWAAWWYGNYAKNSLDPLAEQLRDTIEGLGDGR